MSTRTLYAPLEQAAEYQNVLEDYLLNPEIDPQKVVYYASILYYVCFGTQIVSHGLYFMMAFCFREPAEGEETVKKTGWPEKIAAGLDHLASVGLSGIFVLIWSLVYVSQGTERTASLFWATIGVLFIVGGPTGRVVGGVAHTFYSGLLALLLWSMAIDSTLWSFLHKAAAILYLLGSTHPMFCGKSKAIPFGAYVTADSLLVYVGSLVQDVSVLPSYYIAWKGPADPTWPILIIIWTAAAIGPAVALASVLARHALKCIRFCAQSASDTATQASEYILMKKKRSTKRRSDLELGPDE